nr:circumsporozoite protein-like [Arachis hypogaea]
MGSGAGEGAVVAAGAVDAEGTAEDVAASAEAVRNGEGEGRREEGGEEGEGDGGGGGRPEVLGGGGSGGRREKGRKRKEEEKGGGGFCEGGAVVGRGEVAGVGRWW